MRYLIHTLSCCLIPYILTAQEATYCPQPNTTTAADAVVVFNEVMFHPLGDDPALEWIELHNQMSLDVDLSSWRVEGGIDFEFPTNAVINANGYVVIASDPARLKSASGAVNVFGPFTKRLSNGGETLRLRNHNNRLMDELAYGDSEPWPMGADFPGSSLAKKDRFYASSPAANWRASAQIGGTPGAINFLDQQANTPRTDSLIHRTAVSRWLVPTGATLGNSWTGTSFDDSGWNSGSSGIGYDVSTPTNSPIIADRAYSFDDTLLDVSGHNANAEGPRTTFSHEVPPAIGTGKSLAFDGVSAQAEILDPVNPTAYTISSWVLVNSVRSCSLIVRTSASGPKTSWSHQLRINPSGRFEHYLFDGAGKSVAATNQVIAGVWYHVAATAVNNGRMAIYVNGVASGTGPTIGTMWIGGDRWQLGADSGGVTYFLRGRLDEVGIWHSVLDGATIGRLASGVTPAALSGYRALFQTDVQSSLYQKESSLFARFPFYVPSAGAYDGLALTVRYADGFAAYLNGTEVLRRNIPQTASWNSKANSERVLADVVRPETVDLTPWTSHLLPGKNVLAFQVLSSSADDSALLLNAELSGRRSQMGNDPAIGFNEVAGGDDLPFFVELINRAESPAALANCRIVSSAGGAFTFAATTLAPDTLLTLGANQLGFSVEVGDRLFLTAANGNVLDALTVKAEPRARMADSSEWFSPSNVTPGSANRFDLHDEIVINEIMYHHPPRYRTSSNAFTQIEEQWVELYNRSQRTVDLGGWELAGGIEFTFPPGTELRPDSYLVVANDQAALQAKYPGAQVIGNFGKRLSHHADHVILRDARENLVDEISYFNSHPWPSYPNGGGSSLELKDPRSENALPESWAPSLEGKRSQWKRYAYRAKAASPLYTPAIFNFHEFRLGLLSAGEVLIDNITVTELPTNGPPRQLLQNTNFSGGTSKWRLLGTHSHSFVEPHPENSGDSVLHMVATGAMSYMDNRLETTLRVGTTNVPVVNGREYEISFDAKWLAGSPQVRTELYYNKVAATTIIAMPENYGTPGRRNSTFVTNAGPVYRQLSHFPVLPRATNSIEVSVRAHDPDGVAGMTLRYVVGTGAWQSRSMAFKPTDPSFYTATIPAQPNGSVIQFYVEGVDHLGAASTYPAKGRASRALIKVDGPRVFANKQTFRTIMTQADSSLMHATTNLMSDDLLGCTVVHNEREAFYDARIRLHGSMFSRPDATTTGMTIKFPADHLFRGSRESVIVRRRGMVENFAKHILVQAGGTPANYDDIIYFVSHRNDNIGNARLNLANYDDTFIDSQFEGDNDGTVFKLEGIREFQATHNNSAEGYKLPQPVGWIVNYDIANQGDDPEKYRWGIMIQNQRARDDYSRIVEMAKSFSLSGTALQEAVAKTIDVDKWARLFAVQMLCGIADVYGVENPHNFAMYVRPSDQRVVGLQNDWEFAFQQGNGSIYGNKNVFRILRLPPYTRIYQGHLLDVMTNVCTPAYLSRWAQHLSSVTGENYNGHVSYMNSRVAAFRRLLAAQVPFEITSNAGLDFNVATPVVTFEGRGWIDVCKIRLASANTALPVTWLDATRWQVRLPLESATNRIELQAVNHRGTVVGTDAINVATTFSESLQKDYLRIAEIMYHPADVTGAERTAGISDEDEFEFIELLNTGPISIPLSGVKFTAGITFDFTTAAITHLAPSERVLLVKNATAFALRYGANPRLAGVYSGSLDNSGELIRYEDAFGRVIQEFAYSDSGQWPAAADGSGSSLEAANLAVDFGNPTTWQASLIKGGTPGRSSTAPFFTSATFNGTEVVLRFEALPQRAYSVYRQDNLGSGAWEVLVTIPAKDIQRTEQIIEKLSTRQRFYRLTTP
ncbi:MAG: hypothetical protein FJ403_00975 [Verrucomicrobia bacterium]|nr:hypothetical protein [Verrucomicrobiota bacterium]